MENVFPHAIKRIQKEISEVLNEPLEGIKLMTNDQDITDIQAIIDGPVGTPYEGGKFHVKLSFPERYPTDPPKGFFHTKIFHPNIAPLTGEICVNTLKRDWKPDLGLKHIFLVIRCLLLDPNPDSALNEEAGRLLQEDYDDYVAQARLLTEIHACQHLSSIPPERNNTSENNPKQIRLNQDGGSGNILRDANIPLVNKPVGTKEAQRQPTSNAIKKALKRL